MKTPVAYRMDFRANDPCYSSPEDYEKDYQAGYDGADIYGLFTEPQVGCSKEVEVYKGWCWVRPRHVSAVRDMSGFTPLYIGPILQRAPVDEEILHVFPSIVESRL